MEPIKFSAVKTVSQLSLSSRTHIFPVSYLSGFPVKSCPKLVPLKATGTLSCGSQESNRKFQKLTPPEWTHRFDSVSVDVSEMEAIRREMNALKPNVRKTLMSSQGIDSTKKRVLMIYLLLTFGLAYHFEDEIDESLKEGFEKIEEMMAGEDNLYTVSITFFVFRTYGYHISSDIFKKFKGNNGKFKECLIGDAKGMLALYEAANLGTTTDYIMDEALSFTSSHLELLAADGTCAPHLSKHIRHALTLCQHRNMEMLVASQYIQYYEQEKDHDGSLLKFAKLNFNLLQLHYLEELGILSKWYNDYDFPTNLPPFFRYVNVQNHFFGMAMYADPKFSKARIMLSKIYTAMILLDDTCDRYASLPEIECLINSLDRWSPDDAMDGQPEYLKFVFKFLVECFEEFEREMNSEARSSCAKAGREEFNIYVRSNLTFAKWSHAAHVPSFEEYVEVGNVEVGICMSLAGTLMAMGHSANEEDFKWLRSRPKLAMTACMAFRLINDMTGYEYDMSRGYVTTGVNCYMKQYGFTKMEAISDIRDILSCGFKIINEEFLKQTDVPLHIRKLVPSIIRAGSVCYNGGEGYTYYEGQLVEEMFSLYVNRFHV